MIKPMVVDLYSMRLIYVEFGLFQESETSPGLFKDFMEEYFKILWVANF